MKPATSDYQSMWAGLGLDLATHDALSGCPMTVPNWTVPAPVARAGAVVVGGESCVGERGTRNLTDPAGETVDDLVERLVDRAFQIECAVFTPTPSVSGPCAPCRSA